MRNVNMHHVTQARRELRKARLVADPARKASYLLHARYWRLRSQGVPLRDAMHACGVSA